MHLLLTVCRFLWSFLCISLFSNFYTEIDVVIVQLFINNMFVIFFNCECFVKLCHSLQRIWTMVLKIVSSEVSSEVYFGHSQSLKPRYF